MNDSFDRTIHHRAVTANDTPLYTIAERLRLERLRQKPDRLNGLLLTYNAHNVELAFYGIGNNNGVCSVNILGLPAILERMPISQAPQGPRPLRLAQLTVTFGTSTETDINPITGEAATGTWRAADTIVTVVEGTGITLLDATGVNGISRVLIDPLACHRLFVYVSSLTNMTRVDVQARRLGKFNPFR